MSIHLNQIESTCFSHVVIQADLLGIEPISGAHQINVLLFYGVASPASYPDTSIASVTNQGKARWMIIDGAFNHERLIEFFEALVKDAGCKVLLILDNLSVHHCKPVKAWLARHKEATEATCTSSLVNPSASKPTSKTLMSAMQLDIVRVPNQ